MKEAYRLSVLVLLSVIAKHSVHDAEWMPKMLGLDQTMVVFAILVGSVAIVMMTKEKS